MQRVVLNWRTSPDIHKSVFGFRGNNRLGLFLEEQSISVFLPIIPMHVNTSVSPTIVLEGRCAPPTEPQAPPEIQGVKK